MKVVFLKSTRLDIAWFREYYGSKFAAGQANAASHLREAKILLKTYANIGHASDTEGLRELQVLKTPFLLVYRIYADEIQIVRLWDQRTERPRSWT